VNNKLNAPYYTFFKETYPAAQGNVLSLGRFPPFFNPVIGRIDPGCLIGGLFHVPLMSRPFRSVPVRVVYLEQPLISGLALIRRGAEGEAQFVKIPP
jgi:hypothetical protein